MKKSILYIVALLGLNFSAQAQIKNQAIVKASVNGNCGMCKKTIEKAGTVSKESKVLWDEDTKTASISFDSTKTSEEAILKKIAQAGYDNESFRASDETYAKLHECCQYDRDHETNHGPAAAGHQQHLNALTAAQAHPIEKIYTQYLVLKDALVAGQATQANAQAMEIVKAIQQVDMGQLAEKEHQVWMKTYKALEKDAQAIAAEKSIEKQRTIFINLSQNLYALAKVVKPSKPLYWQHCPMANNNKGANWLSAEEAIKNPYYGSKMLTCGSVKEKI